MITFTIDGSKWSFQNVIAHLTDIKNALEQANIAERLADIGAKAAETAYRFPVESRVEDNKGIVSAKHDGLSFLEFGAGMATNAGHPFTDAVPYPVRRGSWSDEHDGMYKQTGYKYWIFGDRVYTEVVPRGGMLEGSSAIHREAPNVLKDVISNV